MKKSEPQIPLKHSELLFVAMSTLVSVLEARTDYPVDNMEHVLQAYKVARAKHLRQAGYSDQDIRLFTAAATEALLTWLEERAENKERADIDFSMWAAELGKGDDERTNNP